MKRFFSTALLMGVITALAGQSGRIGTVALGETHKPVKGIKINQINGGQVRRPPIRFAEVEIVLSERLSLAYISGLQRAPRSDLEVLDGGRRVKVQLPASVVKALIEEGAEISVIRNFILFEGGAAGGGSENSDMTTRYISATDSIEGSNSNNYPITDNTPDYVTAKSPIDISGAPAGATVTSVDVGWEIWHQWPADVVAALMNETSPLQYVLWYRNYDAPGSFGETVYSISAFNNHAVNQEWQMWAGDWDPGDTGYINHWWIKVYYGEPGPPPPPYCISSGGCREYISNVNVGTINNETDCNGYADYTSLSTMMEIETSNPITVTNGEPYSGDQCGIWVDWNHDEDFDDTGETISVSGGPGTFTASITPPTNAVSGNTRMRIRIMNVGTLGPCGETDYGEVEDYTIIVLGKYCSASGGCTGSGGTLNIDSVQVGSIDNTGTGCSGYADYTSLSTTMEIGTGYEITVTNGDPYDEDDECGIWVDWNQDRDFSDSGEKIAVSGVSEIFWATITPPAAAVLGDTRMRVRIWWGGTLGPCDDSYYGEVEDYTITVTSEPSFVTISGNVETGGGVGIEDVVISASSGESDTTDASGYYELSVQSPWSGTVTPSKSDWSFSPPSRSYSGITTDQPAQNYTGTYISPTITISGYVWTTGIYGLKDVLISASTGESTTTDIYGYYELTLSNPWTGSITPSKSSWTFNPPVKSYVNVGSDMTYVNFGAIAPAVRYFGGLGTEASPYLIRYPEHLQELGSNPADWDKHFELVQYISLSGYTGEQFNMIGLFSWAGISIPFTGVFDGKGYTISGFNYTHSSTKQEFIGIFSYINHADAEVKNLTVTRFEVDGGANGVAEGALVGLLSNGTVTNCIAEYGTVSGQDFSTGGLIGDVWGGFISQCYSSVEVSNPGYVAGGLVGSNQGTISDCSAECEVTGKYGVGGLVGDNQSSGVIELCYSSSNSTGDQYVGGLVGKNLGIISQSHSSGSVGVRGTFQSDIGGLVGRNVDGEIYNCYSTAAVIGGNDCGGLVGLNWMIDDTTIISNCYSTGYVSGTHTLGGLVGYNIDGTVTNSFWDTQTSKRSSSAGGTGKTTAQMQDPNTFLDAGWDFVEETANGTEDIWKLYHPEGYPLLAWERYSWGTGVPSDPYLIYTAEEMQAIGAHPKDWNKCFKLMADIDLSGYTGTEFNIIGHYAGLSTPDNEPFEGIFDGGGHTISNFTYTSSGINCIGLFSYVSGIYAEIRDLTLTGVDISAGSGDLVGALVGRFGGVIANCSADGVISGDKYVGGLVGNTWWGMFYDCYATGSVTGNENVGGLVGDSYIGELFNCYATASVTGGIRVGGLVGDSGSGLFSTCYAAGVVSGTSELGGFIGYDEEGIYTSCLWDSEVNPDVNGIGNITEPNVIGETTANMQTQSTFTDAGWDFVGEMSNGPDDDWGMPDGGGYPVLWWQLASLPALPQLFSGGTGLPGEPYLVSTAGELNSIGHNPQLMDKHFRLIRDIDLAGEDFFMIGGHTCRFAGVFDGSGYVISNFTLEPFPFGQWLGLFQTIGLDGRIEDLGLVDANVGSDHMLSNCIGGLVASNFGTIINCYVAGGDASGYYVVGAIAGRNSGTISDSYSAASVYGTNVVGGLSGLNHWGSIVNCVSTGMATGDPNNYGSSIGGIAGTNLGGTISTSCATGTVSGDRFVGGLVGENIGHISNSYATGDVLANSYGGGLLGCNYGYIYPASISNCYSAGLVSGDSRMGGIVGAHLFGTYTSCFWDTDINPDVNGFGNAYDDPNVTGKTTAEMQTQSTFTDAGWDFTTPVWSILEGIDYPRLAAVSLLLVDLDIDELWMYQNLSGQTKSNLTASVSVADDPAGNSSYSYDWEIILPGDVTLSPITVAGGGSGDAFWTFAARGCDEPGGLSDSGQTFKVRVTVAGDDYGNTGTAEAEFGIALLGDVNNDRAVDIIDRTITNAFMRTGSAGAFTLKDCDVNCDGGVDIIDRTIVNAVMRSQLGDNSVSNPCPLR